MKARWTFIILTVCILLLIVVSAWLTLKLMDHEIGSSKAPSEIQSKSGAAPLVTEEIIEIKPSENKQPLPTAPEKKETTLPAKPVEQVPDAHIIMITGNAMIIETNNSAVPAKIGSIVKLNQRINTDKNSRLEIKFSDGTTVAMGENSSLILDEYVFDEAKPEKNTFSVKSLDGISRTISGQIVKLNPNRFKIKTRMATIGIRGCEVAVRNSANKTDVFVMGLSGEEKISIDHTKDGSPVMNSLNGSPLDVKQDNITTTMIQEPTSAATLEQKVGIKVRKIDPKEFRQIIQQTTSSEPAKQTAVIKPTSTTFEIEPRKDQKTKTK